MALGSGLSTWAGASTPQSNPYTSAPVPFKTPAQQDVDRFKSIAGSVGNQYAPQITGLETSYNNAVARAGGTSAYNDAQQGYLRNDYGTNMAGLGLDRQSLDLNRANLGIDAGGAQRDISYYQQLMGMMPQYRALAGDSYQNTIAKLALAGETERRGINSEATGRGAFFAPMRMQNMNDSNGNQFLGQQAAYTSYSGDLMGLQEKEMGLGRNLGGAQDSAAKIANAQRQTDIDAARLGVTADKYRNDLEQGLAQLGYQNFMSYADLMEMKNSTDINKAQLGQQIIEQAWGLMNSGLGSQYQSYFPQGG